MGRSDCASGNFSLAKLRWPQILRQASQGGVWPSGRPWHAHTATPRRRRWLQRRFATVGAFHGCVSRFRPVPATPRVGSGSCSRCDTPTTRAATKQRRSPATPSSRLRRGAGCGHLLTLAGRMLVIYATIWPAWPNPCPASPDPNSSVALFRVLAWRPATWLPSSSSWPSFLWRCTSCATDCRSFGGGEASPGSACCGIRRGRSRRRLPLTPVREAVTRSRGGRNGGDRRRSRSGAGQGPECS
jgi:hypothetical protein